jgi:putative ABC transport system substrate-binding protein
MQRRNFIAGAVVSMSGWAHAAFAQGPAIPVIGLVRATSPGDGPHFDEAFRKGLMEMGYVENQNVVIERRWAEGHYDRLPAILADLVGRRVAVIAVPGSSASVLAAKAATRTIPIVFMTGVDPVEFELVKSFAHPGGNITGVAQLMVPATAKRLDILRQLIPTSMTFGLLTNPAQPFGEKEKRVAQAAAQSLGIDLRVASAERQEEIGASIGNLVALGARAIVIGGDSIFLYQVGLIADLAAQYPIPTIGQWRDYPAAGGLMSYGNDIVEALRLTGTYVGRILKGEKPADMPVQQPTKFNFVLNIKTAKSLGFTIPDKLLAITDEIIE